MIDNHESIFSLQRLEQTMRLGFKVFSFNFLFFIFHVNNICSSLYWLDNKSCYPGKPAAVTILFFRYW